MFIHHHLRLSISAVTLAAPLCGMAEPLTTTPAPTTEENSQRDGLRVVAPINYEVLRCMEFRARGELATAEWLKAMQTPEFAEERLNGQHEFCAQPHNERVLACEAVIWFRLHKGTGQATTPNGFREVHFQDAKSSEGCSASAVAAFCPGQWTVPPMAQQQ